MEYLDIFILTGIVSFLYIGFAFTLLKASNTPDKNKDEISSDKLKKK